MAYPIRLFRDEHTPLGLVASMPEAETDKTPTSIQRSDDYPHITSEEPSVLLVRNRKRDFRLSVAAVAMCGLFVSSATWAQSPEVYKRQLQANHDQIMAQAQRCQAQMSQVRQPMEDLMNGIVHAQPPCLNQMNAWVAQMAFDECQVYRLETGDRRTSCFQISGVQVNDQ